MGTKIDVHKYDANIAAALKSIKSSRYISKTNKDLILSFYDNCLTNGMGKARVLFYLNRLKKLSSMASKDFSKLKKKDICNIVQKIETSHYSDWTKHDLKLTLKLFFRWMKKAKKYPPEVEWISTRIRNGRTMLPEELLTEEEIKKLVRAASSIRNRALVMTLYESGCRAGEILAMQLKHISFEENCTRIMLNGKTGMRRIPLIASTPYLVRWCDEHPQRDTPESPLWIGYGTRNHNKALGYASLNRLLRKLKEKAGIRKAVHPHMLRHLRATVLSKHITEAQMKQYFGWSQNSDMASIYVHLSGRDLDDALLAVYGLKNHEKKEESLLKPVICPRCEYSNSAEQSFCGHCGLVLSEEKLFELSELKKAEESILNHLLEENKEIKRLLKKILDSGDEPQLIAARNAFKNLHPNRQV